MTVPVSDAEVPDFVADFEVICIRPAATGGFTFRVGDLT